MPDDKVVEFPQVSDIDRQFLELERQKMLIEQQRKRIEEKENQWVLQ